MVPQVSNTPPFFEKLVLYSFAKKMREEYDRDNECFTIGKKRRASFSYYVLPVKRRRFRGQFRQAAHIPERYYMKPTTQAEHSIHFIPTRIECSPKRVNPNANYLAHACGPPTPREATPSNGAKRKAEEDLSEGDTE